MVETVNPRFIRQKPPEAQTYLHKGHLIWHPDESVYFEPVINSFCYFRKTFSLEQTPQKAILKIFADARYMLYVNGQYVGRGPCRSDATWQYYDEYDLSGKLIHGDNLIAVFVVHYGYGTGQYVPVMRCLYVDADITLESGAALSIVSDSSWRCHFAEAYQRNAPRVNGRQALIEIFDARQSIEWYAPSFDDADWQFAFEQRFFPFWNLAPRNIPLLEEEIIAAHHIVFSGETRQADASLPIQQQLLEECGKVNLVAVDNSIPAQGLKIEPSGAGMAKVITVALERVEAGYLQLEIEGAAGTVVDVVYAEETLSGRILLSLNDRPLERFILKEGQNQFEVAFGWKAFRFVQLIFRNDAPVLLKKVALRRRWYPLSVLGKFEVEDTELMQIREISLHTLRLCMQDGFLDSSSREQQQWMGDGRWQAIINYYVSGDARLHRKLLEQIGQSQNWLGLVRARYPDAHYNFPAITTFALAWVASFWDYYLYSGDASLFASWWANLTQLLRWFTAYENQDGLLENLPYWTFVEWGGLSFFPSDETGIITAVNIQYAEALETAIKIAVQVNDLEAAEFYQHKCEGLKQAIRHKLWDETRSAYTDTQKDGIFGKTISEATNALAILHLHGEDEIRTLRIYDNVFSEARQYGVLEGSPYLFILVCRALAKIGLAANALTLMRERYGAMLAAGATTTWEEWDLFHRDTSGKIIALCSASHGWGANPLVFFGESIGGIRPLEPGFRRFVIKPQFCGLQKISLTVPTPYGLIKFQSDMLEAEVRVSLTVPKGTTAVFRDEELDPGQYNFSL